MVREINPQLTVSIRRVVTTGDRDRHSRLDQMGTAVFARELEEALLNNTVDLAVHSLKDVPTELQEGLCLLAVTERLDPRDVLISNFGGLDELVSGSRIGTSSPRRTVQMAEYRPDFDICNIRGNVDTRLRKVSSGEFDGVVLAAAAMLRLGWEDKITEYLPLEHFLPAAGQGALAIETRLDDEEVAELVYPVNHLPTWQSITAERAFLRALAGGCRLPIAALGAVANNVLTLEGMVADVDGKKVLRAQEEGVTTAPEEGVTTAPEEVGIRLAQKMFSMGAVDFIVEGESR
jgi:hydroxymethylbilane synthase